MEAKQSNTLLAGSLAAIILTTVMAYFPAITGGYIWDDDMYLTENVLISSNHGLRYIWFKLTATPQYYPLVFTTFWIEHKLWGLNPFGYHLVNVLLHSANGFLLFFILRRLRIPGALLAAGLFALHPVHVESVAWITELKNVLSGFFYLASLLAFLQFRNVLNDAEKSAIIPPEATGDSVKWHYYPLSLLLFLCALFSKTVTSTLPVTILLLIWWGKNRLAWKDILLTAPFFALGLVSGLTTVWLEKFHVGAQGLEWSFTLLDRCLLASRALWFYAGKLVWPFDLMFVYPRWDIDSSQWQQYLFLLGVMAVFAFFWWGRRKIGRGPLVAVIYFFITLMPALGFFDIYPMRYYLVADHFQYLASIGLIVLLSAFAVRFFEPFPKANVIRLAALGLIFIPLCYQVWQQGKIYKNEETLWRETISRNENAWLAQYNLGVLLTGQGKYAEAVGYLKKSVSLNGNHIGARLNLANSYLMLGEYTDSIATYKTILSRNKEHASANNNLLVAYLRAYKYQEALQHYDLAMRLGVKIDPRIADRVTRYGN